MNNMSSLENDELQQKNATTKKCTKNRTMTTFSALENNVKKTATRLVYCYFITIVFLPVTLKPRVRLLSACPFLHLCFLMFSHQHGRNLSPR